jgi:hypothetical protein
MSAIPEINTFTTVRNLKPISLVVSNTFHPTGVPMTIDGAWRSGSAAPGRAEPNTHPSRKKNPMMKTRMERNVRIRVSIIGQIVRIAI